MDYITEKEVCTAFFHENRAEKQKTCFISRREVPSRFELENKGFADRLQFMQSRGILFIEPSKH
ncbi:MAG: hypothetical protein IJI21_01945 [Clostridia bacterium]|nr:hypothetical protein [Clostridia bacterium]